MVLPFVIWLLGAGVAKAERWPEVDIPLRTGMRSPGDVAVIIGNERYHHLPPVPHAEHDAESMYLWLMHTRGVPVNRMYRVNDGSLGMIEHALRLAAATVSEDGVLWIYYAGHGLAEPTSGERLLLTRDVPADDQHLAGAALSVTRIEQLAQASAAAHTLLILDTSFLGLGREGEELIDETRFVVPGAPTTPSRVTTWVAVDAQQINRVLHPARHGLFTWSVLGALRGWADGVHGDPDGVVTLDEAQSYVVDLFDGMALSGRQTPSRDLRPTSLALPLVAGRFPSAPAYADLPIPEPDPDLDPALDDALLEAQDDAEAERAQEEEVQEQFQAQADREWSETLRAARFGGTDARVALQRFIDRFEARSFGLVHRDLVLTAAQVADARAMLTGGQGGPMISTVRFEPATFRVGSDDDLQLRSEELAHRVTLTRPFLIGTTEVTQRAWVDVMGYNPSVHRGQGLPVDSVSWVEAITFCNALSRLEGLTEAYVIANRQVTLAPDADGYRLPTEAEWELAAGDRRWSGVDEEAALCRHANVLDEGSSDDLRVGRSTAAPAACDDGQEGVTAVRRYRPNSSGLFDLTGNLAEWVFDAWTPHPAEHQTDPAPDKPTRKRILKGGSYLTAPDDARTAARPGEDPNAQRQDVGFRIARTIPQ